MTTTQHTQAPWVVKGESSESGGKAIASVWAPRRPDETRLEGESWLDMRTRTQPERDAIEAEMLEALQELTEWQVKNVKVWDNSAHDNAAKVVAGAIGEQA